MTHIPSPVGLSSGSSPYPQARPHQNLNLNVNVNLNLNPHLNPHPNPDQNTNHDRDLYSEIVTLKTKIALLEVNTEFFARQIEEQITQQINHRFLDTFRRDRLMSLLGEKTISAECRRSILEGNRAAHNGDAVTDATLYVAGWRKDRHVFGYIYGVGGGG
ncbi:hypothetical protein VTN77DRAFT_4080 [Rasamsonia byssochlamydoides]|uniref:uncharacterized protein n=1 Tax=Rasamsonia byssochlamydoides TaxID=89139 RepID=UPI0037431252